MRRPNSWHGRFNHRQSEARRRVGMAQFGFRVGGGYSPNQLSCTQWRRRERARWRRVQMLQDPTSQVRWLERSAKLPQPLSASRNVSCTRSAANSGAGRAARHSDIGNRRGNPSSFPVRCGDGKRRGRRFRPWSVRGVGFARKIGRLGPRILTTPPSESFSGDRTGARHRIASRCSYAFLFSGYLITTSSLFSRS